jgi:uncharacterized repeat protein (TIGR03843 family)
MTDDAPAGQRSIRLETLLRVLREGKQGSNDTFLALISQGEHKVLSVYKPTRGEQPLWDFPENTLAHREVAAYVVSAALGWDFVPPTVLRDDGPHGPGSLQFYVHTDPECHYFTLNKADKAQLPRVALFDVLVNNADRKGGHILKDKNGKLWLIDHGICFNAQHKLRTVVWDFSGQPIAAELLAEVSDFRSQLEPQSELTAALRHLLAADELAALRRRADRVLHNRHFPEPGPGRNYPWPPL